MMLLSRLSYIHVLLPGCAVSNNIPRGHKYWYYFLIIDCLNDFQREEVIQLDQEQSLLHIYNLDKAALPFSVLREGKNFGTYFQVVDEVGVI